MTTITEPILRVNMTMPTPVLGPDGIPDKTLFVPTVTEATLGNLQIMIGGFDVTFFRNMPPDLKGWGSSEPFGDDVMNIEFPQIGPWEKRGPGTALPWLVDWAPVELFLWVTTDIVPTVGPTITAGTRLTLFEGHLPSFDDELDDVSFKLVLAVRGCIHMMHNYDKPPSFSRNTYDIGKLISDEVNYRIDTFGTALAHMADTVTGVQDIQRGNWTDFVSGYLTDLLNLATVQQVPSAGATVLACKMTPSGDGYYIMGDDGVIMGFGKNTPYFGTYIAYDNSTRLPPPPPLSPAHGFDLTATGKGYWVLAENGAIFPFGDAVYYGSPYSFVSPLTGGQIAIAMAATPTGLGYYILQLDGTVTAWGDAVYHGSAGVSGWAVGIAVDQTGGGYWVVDLIGTVFAFGDAVNYGSVSLPSMHFAQDIVAGFPSGYWVVDDHATVTAFGGAHFNGDAHFLDLFGGTRSLMGGPSGYYIVATDGGVFPYPDSSYSGPNPLTFLGSATTGGGNWYQWSMYNAPGRIPYLAVKDTWTDHHIYTCGVPGLKVSLSKDKTQEFTAFLGEGIDTVQAHWRNTRYPTIVPNDPPVWMRPISLTSSPGDDILQWKEQAALLSLQGGPNNLVGPPSVDPVSGQIDNVYRQRDFNICVAIQRLAGLPPLGVVDSATWITTFNVGGVAGDPNLNAYFAPLAERPECEPFLYNASGVIIGANPAYDPSVQRVEFYANYGVDISLIQGIASAKGQVKRYINGVITGTLECGVDPQNGSRFLMRAGENVLLKDYLGADLRLHITKVEVDFETLVAKLTVSNIAPDLISYQAIRTRDHNANDPTRRQAPPRRLTRVAMDRISVWDAESGAGKLPLFILQANTWVVLRLAYGQRGSIVRANIQTFPACEFVVGLFDSQVTAALLAWIIPGGPLQLTPGGEEPWDLFPDSTGLFQAWGSTTSPAGYSPGDKALGSPLTGTLEDGAQYAFISQDPPWVYAAFYSAAETVFSGQFFPAMEGY